MAVAKLQKPTPRTKRFVAHSAFLLLIIGAALYGRTSVGADRSSLLYAVISGTEDTQGPLNKSAYAQTDTVSPQLASATDNASVLDSITFADPEVYYNVQTAVGGTSVVAPLNPIMDNPQEMEKWSTAQSSNTATDTNPANTDTANNSNEHPSIQIYTVTDGDTVASLAMKFHISRDTIVWANGLQDSDSISIGDRLIIPPTTGVIHIVHPGDTLSGIAKKYDVSATSINKYNDLGDESALQIGQKVIVPGGSIPDISPVRRIAQAPVAVPNMPDNNPSDEPLPTAEPPAKGASWIWPVGSHDISQRFGVSGHTGVDIDKDGGTPIYAARSGTVEFSGWLGGYGNLIILNHGHGVQTYYAHQAQFKVHAGQSVAGGQVIGIVGTTGHSTGYHLHFELRKNGVPTNPLVAF